MTNDIYTARSPRKTGYRDDVSMGKCQCKINSSNYSLIFGTHFLYLQNERNRWHFDNLTQQINARFIFNLVFILNLNVICLIMNRDMLMVAMIYL